MKKLLISCLATVAVFGLGGFGNSANAQPPPPASEVVEFCKFITEITGGPIGQCMQFFESAEEACVGLVVSDISSSWPGPDSPFAPPPGALALWLEIVGLTLNEFVAIVCGGGPA